MLLYIKVTGVVWGSSFQHTSEFDGYENVFDMIRDSLESLVEATDEGWVRVTLKLYYDPTEYVNPVVQSFKLNMDDIYSSVF